MVDPGLISPDDEDIKTAKQILNAFEEKDFEASSTLINRLVQKRCDIKANLNHSVIEYRKSNCTLTDEFLICLQNLQLRIDAENLEDVDNGIEFCVLYYNQALMHYYTKQFSSALKVLNKLLLSFENLSKDKTYESFAKLSACLMMQVLLVTYKPEECLKLISWFESCQYLSKDVLTQYKLKCHIMLKSTNPKTSKLFNSLTANQNTTLLKSEWDYVCKDFDSCLKLLNSLTSPSTSPNFSMKAFNNIALMLFQTGSYHTALSKLSQAVKIAEENDVVVPPNAFLTSTSLSGRPVNFLSDNNHNQLLHNTAVTLLHCGKPTQAFDIFLNIVQVYPNNSRLWLRLAECSVAVYKQTSEDPATDAYRGVVHKTLGLGKYRKIVLDCVRKPKNHNKYSSAIPMPTMEFASLCVKNALVCLNIVNDTHSKNSPNNKDAKSLSSLLADISHSGHRSMNTCLAPSALATACEVDNLKRSALLLSSYLSLHHQDFHQALQTSNLLLSSANLPSFHRYLGQVYKARSLVGLDKLGECEDLLLPDSITDVSRFPGKEKVAGVKMPMVEECRAVMNFNRAVTLCMSSKHQQAQACFNKSVLHLPQPHPSHVFKLKLYLNSVLGENQNAVKEADIMETLK